MIPAEAVYARVGHLVPPGCTARAWRAAWHEELRGGPRWPPHVPREEMIAARAAKRRAKQRKWRPVGRPRQHPGIPRVAD